MRKSVIALAAVVVLAGAAVAAVPVIERHAAAQHQERDRARRHGQGRRGERRPVRPAHHASEPEVQGRRGGAQRRPLAGVGAGLADRRAAGRPHAAWRASAGAIRCRPTASSSRTCAMADKRRRRPMEHGRAADRGLRPRALRSRPTTGMFRFAVLTARAMGALTMRRLEQRNTRITLPGTGETVGLASVVLEGYERGRVAALAMAGIDAAAARRTGRPVQHRRDQGHQDRPRPHHRGHVVRQMVPRRAVRPHPCRNGQRHGFRRRAVQALRHLAGRRQLPDDPGQGQGEPHAHAGRGLRAGAAVARPRRPVVAHGPAVDGHQGREGRFRLPWHGGPGQGRADDRSLRAGQPGSGRDRARGARRQCRCDLLERPRRERPAGVAGFDGGSRLGAGWCWPTRACWTAACAPLAP